MLRIRWVWVVCSRIGSELRVRIVLGSRRIGGWESSWRRRKGGLSLRRSRDWWGSSRTCVCRGLCRCVVVVFVTCDTSVNVLRRPCFSKRQYPSALCARSSQAAAVQDPVPAYMSTLASYDRVHPWCKIVQLSLAEMARKIKRWYAIAKPSGLELGQMTHRGLDTLNLEA